MRGKRDEGLMFFVFLSTKGVERTTIHHFAIKYNLFMYYDPRTDLVILSEEPLLRKRRDGVEEGCTF